MSDASTKTLPNEADRLIQRRRIFIASSATSSQTVAAAPDLVFDVVSQDDTDTEDDLPLLTEVVTYPSPAPASFNQAHRDEVHKELARWLAEELPEAILKVTDGVADQLMRELTNQAEQQLLPRLLAHLDNTNP